MKLSCTETQGRKAYDWKHVFLCQTFRYKIESWVLVLWSVIVTRDWQAGDTHYHSFTPLCPRQISLINFDTCWCKAQNMVWEFFSSLKIQVFTNNYFLVN